MKTCSDLYINLPVILLTILPEEVSPVGGSLPAQHHLVLVASFLWLPHKANAGMTQIFPRGLQCSFQLSAM